MQRLIIVFFFGILSISALGQGTIKGVVYDRTSEETLIGASVRLINDITVGSSTDYDGQFSFVVPEGAQKIVCSYTGMKSDTLSIIITKGQTAYNEFSLEMISEELGTVVVSAGKFEQKLEELTVSMNVIKPALIENKNTTNITQVLELTPGLTIMDEEPQIRSGSGYSFGLGSRVAILVDDLPLTTGDMGKAEWSFIPTENVEQIEVIKGASSVLYGSSALSGVINVRTAYPKDEPLTKVNIYSGLRSAILEENASTGKRIANFFGMDASEANGKKWWNGLANYSGMNFLHSRKIGQLDLVLGGNFHYDHGFIGPPKPLSELDTADIPAGSRPFFLYGQGYYDLQDKEYQRDIKNSEVREVRGRVNFNLRYRDKKRQGLSYGLNGNFMRSSKNFSLIWQAKGDDRESIQIPGWAVAYDSTKYINNFYNSQDGLYRAYPGTMTLTELTTFYVDPFVKLITSTGVQHSLRGRVLYADNRNSNNQDNQSTTVFGEYQFQRLVFKRRSFGMNVIAGAAGNYTMSKSQIFLGADSSGENNAKNASLYMQLDLKLWKVLNINLGARGEYYQINEQEFVVKPVFRAGLSTKMGKATYLRFSYGQGYRFPTLAEKFISTTSGGFGVLPNPDLNPETSWNMEIGAKQGFKVGKFYGYLDIVGFWQEFTNSIDFAMVKGTPPSLKFYNTGDTRVRGVEASVMGGGDLTENFGVQLIVGYTFTSPQALEPNKPFDILPTPTPGVFDTLSHATTSAAATTTLKYRFQHLASGDVEFRYKKCAVGYSIRYYSYVQNIDKVLYTLDASNQFNTGVIQWRNDQDDNSQGAISTDYILNDGKSGEWVMDARVSYQATKWMKVAFIVNNFMNRSYSLRPAKIESPRTAAIQLTFKV
ncbi:MAG: outer membrane cobalamin receptor [Bacteroidia bacterium]|jgi:outer membrane cobalamin receptor